MAVYAGYHALPCHLLRILHGAAIIFVGIRGTKRVSNGMRGEALDMCGEVQKALLVFVASLQALI
jgi:hypothetical protein